MVIRFAGSTEIGRDQARKRARCMFGVGGWPMTSDSSQFRPLLRAVFSLCCLSFSGTNFNLQKPSPMTAFRVRCPVLTQLRLPSILYYALPLYPTLVCNPLGDAHLFPVKAGHVLHWGTESNQNAGRNGGLLSRGRHAHGGHS